MLQVESQILLPISRIEKMCSSLQSTLIKNQNGDITTPSRGSEVIIPAAGTQM